MSPVSWDGGPPSANLRVSAKDFVKDFVLVCGALGGDCCAGGVESGFEAVVCEERVVLFVVDIVEKGFELLVVDPIENGFDPTAGFDDPPKRKSPC